MIINNCRDAVNYPLSGNCLVENVICSVMIKSDIQLFILVLQKEHSKKFLQ